MNEFRSRLATEADVPQIAELMLLSIQQNMSEFLSAAEIEAAKESMGVDRLLIADGTYFVIEAQPGTASEHRPIMVGCGGWGKRRTLYGGDHTAGRDDALSDPEQDAARIRAMYTHPDWTRRGIGTLLLELGEAAARAAGFATIELSREVAPTANGAGSVIITMAKSL